MNKGIHFIDAQEMSKNNDTFEAPDLSELNELEVGNTIKVCADGEEVSGERFWCEILSIDGENIEARVDNDLIHAEAFGFTLDDTINFNKNNVYNIWKG